MFGIDLAMRHVTQVVTAPKHSLGMRNKYTLMLYSTSFLSPFIFVLDPDLLKHTHKFSIPPLTRIELMF